MSEEGRITRILPSAFCLLPFKGGMFLWHYPHARTHWGLPSKSGLSGVRTFLKPSQRKTCNHLADSLSISV